MEKVHAGATIGDLVCRAVRRYGDRLALVAGDERLTYSALGARINQIMQALKARGVNRSSAVCQLTPNTAHALLVRYAVNLLGARLNVLNPLNSTGDQAFMAGDCESDVLVIDACFGDRIVEILQSCRGACRVLTIGPAALGDDLLEAAAAFTPQALRDEADPNDIPSIVYTGGTTGQPKGVAHSHLATVASSVAMCAEFEWPDDIRLLVSTPLSHAGGGLVLPTWMRGGTVYLQDGFDVGAFLELIEREGINVAWMVPTMIYRLLDDPRLGDHDLSCLKRVIYGGSPMQPSRMQQALDRFGQIFVQLYAQREAPMPLTTLNSWDHVRDRPDRLASCGVPAPHLQVRLLDAHDREVPGGEVGEICIRGPVVMRGYWRRPQLTAETLRNGWLHTGDMARADAEGFITIVDRKKDMIISGGFNVYPREVEDVIGSHPAVAQVAVIGVPDDKWGERVTAIVVCREGKSVPADELIALVRDRKGAVQAPKTIEFVDSIPVTPIGKPDKKVLRARYWGGETRQVH